MIRRADHLFLLPLLLLLFATLPSPVGLAADGDCDCDLAACLATIVEEHRQRGWIGVGLAGSGGAAGLAVVDLVPDGPADRAGLVRGDRIVAIDGNPFEEGLEATYARLGEIRANERVRLTVQPQEGERKIVTVRAVEAPPERLQQSIGTHVLNLVHRHTAAQRQTLRSGDRPSGETPLAP